MSATRADHDARMRALRRANEVRVARAGLRRRIAAGALRAADVILAPPSEAAGWSLLELLMCQRGWGHARARRFLAGVQIDERKPVGGLTERQRRLVASRLAVAAGGRRAGGP
jgi:hypothetical protein